jgi:hypothetical protein
MKLDEAAQLIATFDLNTYDAEGNALGEYEPSDLVRFILDFAEFGAMRGRYPSGVAPDSRWPPEIREVDGDKVVDFEQLLIWWGLRGRQLYALMGVPDLRGPDET